MIKTFTTFLTLFISLSLFAKTGKITLSGQVQNHSETTIAITHLNNQKLVSAELDADGNFNMSTDVEDGYYLLSYGRNTAYIYLYPQDKLSVTFDAKQFEGSLVFNGEGAARNNYLVKKDMMDSQLTEDLEAFYKVDEATYLKNLENVKNTHLASLATYEVEEFFITEEKKSLEYARILAIQNYTDSYKFYLGDEISPSEEFYTPVKALKLDNEDDYRKQPYYRYLANSFWSDRIDAATDVEGMLDVLREVPSEALFISLINGFYSKISSNKERAKDYLDLIKRVTDQQSFIEASEKQYQEVLKSQGYQQGDTSPPFSFESIDGSTINLSDLKGKYVYIDVWATWCAPCLKQVPYLKQLEARYHGKNVVFVSIAVDKPEFKATWKQMVADKQLGGVQLFADNSFDSDFMDAYAVNSIPRFILLDPEGKIVNPDAPQPSFEKTRELLDGLVN